MYTSHSSTTARVAIRSAADPGKTYGLNDTFQVSTNFSMATQSFTFLASEADSSYITGTVIQVMGGETTGG
jgi:NAD(P)-dependent dehydrogenase (short-subunit alcohol dehydrogenase family)